MDDKEKYFQALKKDNGVRNEIEIGEMLGFDESETQKIISMLLFDYKIEFVKHGACNYKIKK